MADELGAVRRTPRPTGDRQTPETVAQLPRGATNAPTPVSTDAGNGTGDLSPEVAAALVERHGPELEALADVARHGLDQLRGKLHASAVLGHLHTTDDDMQAFVELPDCLACEGTGKDDHGSPFEQPLAVHFAGPPVEIAGRRRQLCMWCGHVLSDVPLKDAEPAWPAGEMIRVEDGLSTVVPYLPCDTLPPGCCALPDEGDEPVCACDPETERCSACADEPATPPPPSPWVRCPNTPPCEHPSLIHDVSGDPEDPKPMCCVGGCRCGQPADGPDEAQETRAADGPANDPREPEDGDHG